MIYALLRAIAGIALRWHYSDVQVAGAERIPRDRPLLLVANHPNALVDALLVGWILPRRVLITAKATLFVNPIGAALLRWLGVLPLRRASDERALAGTGAKVDRRRNTDTLAAVQAALADGGCVLIFPEGRTPDEPALAPLKTGAARIALQANESGQTPTLAILPFGLVFERKEAPRSRVYVEVGEPILVAEWAAARPTSTRSSAIDALTADIEARLRAMTLSYPTLDDAARSFHVASVIASAFEPTPAIGVVDRRLATETAIAKRIAALTTALPQADATMRHRADDLVARIADIHELARRHHVPLEDVHIDLDARPAGRFALREGWILLAGAPVALWGRLNHWLPFQATKLVARRNVSSAADPAMRTIVAGTGFVILAYLAQTALVWRIFGHWIAIGYLVSLPIAADINFALSDRMRRAYRRARAFFVLRRNPALRERLTSELARLRADIEMFDAEMSRAAIATPGTAQ